MYIDPSDSKPLYQQVYEQCRHAIIDGSLSAGEKLTPIRKMASDLGVARNTVETAYRQLLQEGFVSSRSGSGYTVERLNIDEMLYASSVGESFDIFDDAEKSLLAVANDPSPSFRYDFAYGNLQEDAFPAELWRKLTTDALFSAEAGDLSRYNDSQGDFLLRLNISNHLRKTRGVRCFPEQIVIQAGTQSSIMNLLQLFNPLSDSIAMEEPGYDGVRLVFEHCRFKIIPCPVLEGGSGFIRAVTKTDAKLCFVTPSNQFPTGQMLSIRTRQMLLDWARTNGSYILEDDYCREFRYNAKASPSLQSLDTYHRVIYIGTYSKALSPALRMSYLILPPDLLNRWQEHFKDYHATVPWLSQVVLRRFIEQGHWEKAARRAQTRNRRKRELLLSTIKKTMGSKVVLMEGGAGLHILVGVKDGRAQEELIQQAASVGVGIYGTDRYWMSEDHPLDNYVLVGFSAINEEDIEPGIQALAAAWFDQRSLPKETIRPSSRNRSASS